MLPEDRDAVLLDLCMAKRRVLRGRVEEALRLIDHAQRIVAAQWSDADVLELGRQEDDSEPFDAF